MIVLGGCATTVRDGTGTPVPGLPSAIPRPVIPDPPELRPFRLDVPRDMSRLVPKNTSECRKTPEVERTDEWWARCGVHPPLVDSNILFGFGPEDWASFQYDMRAIRAWIAAVRRALAEWEREIDALERRWRTSPSDGNRTSRH